MKILGLLLTVASFQLAARGYTQGISLSVKNAPLENVFKVVEKQTDWRFVYSQEAVGLSTPVTITVKNESLDNLLKLCFADQPLSYTKEGNYIIVKVSAENKVKILFNEVKGRVVNESGEPLEGISILTKGTNQMTTTNREGVFYFKDIDPHSILLISGAEIEGMEIKVDGRNNILITAISKIGVLHETIIKGYYTTSKKLNTGSVSKVTAKELATQPVSNVLAALQGRSSGLLITQSSGIPGSSFQIQVRGQNSIAQGNDPYIIIDGVPFAPNNSNINQVSAAFSFSGNGLSPLNTLNPADIESIEILKDADATAIYGSKGANGVILITTKKGKVGKTKVEFNIYTGVSKVTKRVKLLNTSQYVAMRKEAFFNDGVIPTNANAYDILLWDTTRYTDLVKELIGGTAESLDAQVSVSGGSDQTQFMLRNGFHRETTVYPGRMSDKRASLHFNLHHFSTDRKFALNFTAHFSHGNNNIIISDLSKSINLPPNLPSLYDSSGNLNWSNGGFSFVNPLSFLRQSYIARSENFLVNTLLSYKVQKNLTIKSSFGYNTLTVNDRSITPISSRNPASNPTGSSQFGYTSIQNITVEPQIQYELKINNGKLDVLAGGSWQQNVSATHFLLASGYTNDALLQSISAAGSLFASGTNGEYRYGAFFTRINYNHANKYLINVTGRSDGSSRFGPGRQFATFGAIGAGWIFTKETFFEKAFPWINYGKLRMSYGSAGNDNIGDYQYLDKYSPTPYPYQGIPGITPNNLFNPDYSWEINRKLEIALEVSLLNNRLNFSAAFFQNRSGNQLIQTILPSQTGFVSILKNFPALLQNRGVEIELLSKNIKKGKFEWTSSFNLTIPRNTLLSFPGLDATSYRNQYQSGSSLNIGNGFRLTGVNPQTGIYEFSDVNGVSTNLPVSPRDFVKGLAKLDPRFYGGLQNSFTWNRWESSIFFEFRKQTGISYLYNFISTPAGTRFNQPALMLQRWQRPGDVSSIQRFTTTTNNPAYLAANLINFTGADNKFTDASYIRMKNFSLSYSVFPSSHSRRTFQHLKLYLEGQNLFTFTRYKGGDPETQNALRLPPLKTIVAGIQLTL